MKQVPPTLLNIINKINLAKKVLKNVQFPIGPNYFLLIKIVFSFLFGIIRLSCSSCQREINEAKLHSGQGHFFNLILIFWNLDTMISIERIIIVVQHGIA